MTKTAKYEAALMKFPPNEREKIRRVLSTLGGSSYVSTWWAGEVAKAVVVSGGRALSKRSSDARTDRARRVLVGARVPRAFADRCKAAADRERVSLYRWVVSALTEALHASEYPGLHH